MLRLDDLAEYDAAATWCAKRGLKGACGDPLPGLLSVSVLDAINEDPEAFEDRVRATAYALAMEARVGPGDGMFPLWLT
mgnify:CR=1 FL=1